MRRTIMVCLAVVWAAVAAQAQDEKAAIAFDETTISFGAFSEKEPRQSCTFTFTNVGGAPLVINEAVASCGCTVPTYTKKPVLPGESGQIEVTYDGRGKFLGHFKKTITVYTNGEPSTVRLYIEGDMTE